MIAAPRANYTPEQLQDRGRRAKALLTDPILRDAIAKLQESIELRWVTADTTAKREKAHADMLAARGLLEQLKVIVQYGEHPTVARAAAA